ncbi:polysaccharide pyruvyl transferase family protein [Aquiluna borgnonia]|uniref:Polysaccharide pyruvyl transferase family protein n=1 Tax=Aquiluna borgnonia TaxID=2499157 RepID=A0A7D4Q3G2_9MICO|nr:polysaccharide pyruvyl transferase family protein [Aquiluna borgnonia]QKJ24749.1 polysaccharide pyruvyl transferase family protein [Aquiluna borgnonia]
MSNRDVVICSFYTPDEYYGGHARELREQLTAIGVGHELLEIQKNPGEDWADVTRRKIGFIRDICHKHPDKMVFWIDVDCRITHLPDYISNTTADLIGFQRSFGSPLQIGYHNRTRFWEPSFWGVNATEQGRKLVEDAYELEQRADIKATDDYFLEEAWRANAKKLTFQMIPATAIVRDRKLVEPGSRDSFFVFGSSGNVADFKDKVVQHGTGSKTSTKKKLLKQAKKIEKALPDSIKKPLRRLADSTGVTGLLTSGKAKSIDPERSRMVGEMLGGGIKGDAQLFVKARAEFENKYIPSFGEASIIHASEAFLSYAGKESDDLIRLAWWSKPFPGNFGDWLSPLIVSHYTPARITLQSPVKPAAKKHIIALGSIGRFIKANSVVLGTGISTDDVELNRKADYVSVRGPITARVLKESGGPSVENFGDPGLALSRIIPVTRGETNGRIAFIRHFSHTSIPMQLPEHMDELSVLMSKPDTIADFVATLAKYDKVLTSAMHVMITCQSYGIPCGLVTFEGYEENVHGSGIKYEDYALGAGVEVMNPQVVGLDLSRQNLDNLIRDIRVSEAKKDEVIEHIHQALSRFGKK